jgi:ATP-dependent DNA helicase RecQ
MQDNLEAILKQYWGYDQFRPQQKDIINSVLSGKDTIALLPTGGGKSICFQVPALALSGCCLVVSPLIALMKDQVERLKALGIKADYLHSNLTFDQQQRILDNVEFNQTKFLYVSPERLGSDLFISRLVSLKLSLLAIDEAHCISQWGYDFRPAYLKINKLRQLLPDIKTISLTASATPQVVKDIIEKLEMKDMQIYQSSFVRSNLSFVVRETEDKKNELVSILKKVQGTALIYVRSRKLTVDVSTWLMRNNINSDFYHAGLTSTLRNQKQQDWIHGKCRVMVCTNAFGMGIDKADVRIVVHHQLSDSLEAYYQEAGRAGRDGKKSYAVLLKSKEDDRLFEEDLNLSIASYQEIKDIYQLLLTSFGVGYGNGLDMKFEFDLVLFCKKYSLLPKKVLYAINVLEYHEYIIYTDRSSDKCSLQIIVGNSYLYDFMRDLPKAEPLIKLLLRTSPGIFELPITINEEQIAKKLTISIEKLRQQLSYLHANNIVRYTSSNDNPFITLITERLTSENLQLDKAFLKMREQQIVERKNVSRYYFYQHQTCRANLIAHYFGEKTESTCGICDVCLSKKQKDDFNPSNYYSQMMKSLKIPKHLDDLTTELGINRKNGLALAEWGIGIMQIRLNDEGKYEKI